MEAVYHRQLLRRALAGRVSPRALASIEAANVRQDSPLGLLKYAWHFDNSLFAEGLAYIEACRAATAVANRPALAWTAFGRLTHAAQDFYAHSNYVALWHDQLAPGAVPPMAGIDGLDPGLLWHPRLASGRIYLPWEALTFVPALRPLARRLLPRDAHAWMNLDRPDAGPFFAYSLEAAAQRTQVEFERTVAAIDEYGGEAALRAFLDQ